MPGIRQHGRMRRIHGLLMPFPNEAAIPKSENRKSIRIVRTRIDALNTGPIPVRTGIGPVATGLRPVIAETGGGADGNGGGVTKTGGTRREAIPPGKGERERHQGTSTFCPLTT